MMLHRDSPRDLCTGYRQNSFHFSAEE